jgi:uncharacterized membrane protein YoaK (UPF0700 family)
MCACVPQPQSKNQDDTARPRFIRDSLNTHDSRTQAVAAALAALAGFVDACGFLASGGFFVSFMSGNSTRAGVGLADASKSGLIAFGLIAVFLMGVIVGALAGYRAQSRRRPVVLAIVAGLLACGAALSAAGLSAAALAAMALAMGAMNNVFERNGEVSIGVTYMTGSLVKLGQGIVAALIGTSRFGWLSYFVLWLSFVLGVVSGAVAYPHFGLSGLWIAALVASTLAGIAWNADDRL